MNIFKKIIVMLIVRVIAAAHLRMAFKENTTESSSKLSSPEIKILIPPIPFLALPGFRVAPGFFKPAWESISDCDFPDVCKTSHVWDKK